MHRRTFLGAVAAGFVAAPLTAEPQPDGKAPRIGVLWPYSPAATSPFADALRQGLRDRSRGPEPRHADSPGGSSRCA